MPRPTLLGLPTEILSAICATLCAHCICDPNNTTSIINPSLYGLDIRADTEALASLSRTCRQLHDVAMPYLYHCFAFKPEQHLLGFVRTISQRPDLGTLVRHVQLFAKIPDHREHLAFIHHQAVRRGMLLPDDWMLPTEDEDDDDYDDVLGDEYQYDLGGGVLVDLLLNIAVHLEQLAVELFNEQQFGRSLPPSMSLPSLRAVSLLWYDEGTGSAGLELGAVAGLFEKAPKLERLEVSCCYSVPPGLALGNLTRLQLNDTILSTADLRRLATACPSLTAFTFCADVSDELVYVDTEEFIPRDLPEGLLPCSDTLQHLEIDVSKWVACQGFEREHVITSLTEFTALKNLILDGVCLGYGEEDEADGPETEDQSRTDINALVDLLPASIESVTISGNHPSLYNPILELAQQVQNGLFPRLKTFRETGFDPSLPPHPFQPLQDAMQDAGVSFVPS